MEKSLIFLICVGSLIGAGIILSFYGAQLTTQNLTVKEDNISPSSSLEITVDLSTSVGKTGVYGILTDNFEEGKISATVYDPVGTPIISKPIDKKSSEDRFEINSSGSYKLVIENSGLEMKHVVAGIGYMPDNTILSVGIIGFYVLIVGLIGIIGIGIYAIRNRRKKN
jgi:hypothetical protein